MAKTDPLAQLKDIQLPTPINWWPLAPGWYVLILLVLLLILYFIRIAYRKHRHALAKNQALNLLQTYKEQYDKVHNVSVTSAQISELLRRVALVYYPREQVASLYGEAWLTFLQQNSKGIDFTSVKSMLLDAPFKSSATMNLKPLFDTAQLWIKQRRVPCSN